MNSLLCIPFFYNDQYYQMLLRRVNGERDQLRVTVMNGELEKRLHGYSVFEILHGNILAASPKVPDEIKTLHAALISGIERYYEEHSSQKFSFA